MTIRPTAVVVGAGLYGCLTALELARAGCQVELIEKRSQILSGASGCNQGRLHLGYHYPRSSSTALACQAGAKEFADRFPETIQSSDWHYYCLAEESEIDWGDYLEACQRSGLSVTRGLPPVELRSISGCLWTQEAFLSLELLRARLQWDLAAAGVVTHLGRMAATRQLRGRDMVIDATHGQNSGYSRKLRYEVVELVTVRLPESWRRLSMVIMDGPFCSIDPIPERPGYHYLYDVRHSVHFADEGAWPRLPSFYLELIDDESSQLSREASSHFEAMRASAVRYAPSLQRAEYVSSNFALRTILPDMDVSDGRPTLIEHSNERLIRVIGGKLADAPAAARRVRDMVLRKSWIPHSSAV